MLWILISFFLLFLIIDQIWTRQRRLPPRLYRASPTLGWTLTPGAARRIELAHEGQKVWENHIVINSYGFNDRDWPHDKGAQKRVMVMGDSIIESRQVDRSSNFVSLAEAKLNALSPNGYEVLNVGVAGWSADSALNYFQQAGRPLRPDIVIFGLFMGNDLVEGDYETFRYLFAYAWDCRRYDKPAFGLENGSLVRRNYPAWRNVMARIFSEELYVHSCSFRKLYQHFNRFMEKRKNGSNLLRKKGVSYNMYMERTKGYKFFYDQTEAQIDALAKESRQAGAAFGVVLIPNFPLFYPLTIDDPKSRAYWEYQIDLKHYHEMNRRLSSKYAILSLIEPLHAASEPISFKPAEHHFNFAGHELVAKLLADFIIEFN
ncbi:MAG: Lipolytic protein G-D-S-L family [Nitrospirae bacterium]|nr:MAG: Lipolytic protein G-D-S-L family [Nitrospirota bacterium]